MFTFPHLFCVLIEVSSHLDDCCRFPSCLVGITSLFQVIYYIAAKSDLFDFLISSQHPPVKNSLDKIQIPYQSKVLQSNCSEPFNLFPGSLWLDQTPAVLFQTLCLCLDCPSHSLPDIICWIGTSSSNQHYPTDCPKSDLGIHPVLVSVTSLTILCDNLYIYITFGMCRLMGFEGSWRSRIYNFA